MYGNKLLWTGLTLMLAAEKFFPVLPLDLVGAIIMIIGAIVMWLDK